MSFAWPLVLLGLLAIPIVIHWYASEQRRRERATEAFVTQPLMPSVAPERPRWRRHVPMLAFAVALAVLIVAAARPQTTEAVPRTDGAIMLANDISSSMRATDVKPTRLGAAQQAAQRFLAGVPSGIRVGLLEFNQRAIVLQSPTSDHSLTRDALSQLRAGGHTAIGDAIAAAIRSLTRLPLEGARRPPSAIVLLSDGTSTNGQDPIAAARQAAAQHIPIYTIALGTSRGTIAVPRGSRVVQEPVPPDPRGLAQIARVSGGRTFLVGDTKGLSAVYDHLAKQLGHKRVKQEVTASFAGAGLILLLLGSAASLRWFGRLI